MVRLLRDLSGEGGGGFINAPAVLILWAAVVSISIISTVIFSCTGGGPKDKTSSHSDTYGAACAAGCGAGCGG